MSEWSMYENTHIDNIETWELKNLMKTDKNR